MTSQVASPPVGPGLVRGAEARRGSRRSGRAVLSWLPVVLVGVLAVVMRFWQLDRLGFNSDEAVYAGTAASIAGDPDLRGLFPVFRAHPVLFQALVSLALHGGVSDFAARACAAGIGVGTVALTFLLARRLYGHTAGVLAAFLLAVMPYHVVVSRQVLLDGLLCLGATATLYCVARYAESSAFAWLLATGAMMGLTVLAKETGIILLGGLYVFFALTPLARLRRSHVAAAVLVMCAVAAVSPAVLAGAGGGGSGGQYLLWQLFRRPNHELAFYATVVPPAVGFAVLAAAVAGLIWLRRESTWRERLLLAWLVVPVIFFTLWPVKGYQYLLPAAPVVAVLAGRALARVVELARRPHRRGLAPRVAVPLALALSLAVGASIAVPAWASINPAPSEAFLAGAGGLPGGRAAGQWIAAKVPAGSGLLAIGPSMANVLQFYSGRRVQALSVSPNPLTRNPSYQPVVNPDRALRDGAFQYLIWDAYSASRSPFFAAKLRQLVDRYHGVAVYTGTIVVNGTYAVRPLIVVYHVRFA